MIRLLILVTFLGLGSITNCVLAQPSPVKRCAGVKKNGEPCKSTFILKSGYCRAHDPNTPKCGAKTAKGYCQMPVTTPGTRCRFHI